MKFAKPKARTVCLAATLLALLGLAFVAFGDAIWHFMKHVDKYPAAIAWPLGLLTFALLLVAAYGYPIGTGVLCYQLSARLAFPPFSLPAGLRVPISGNLFMAIQALPFLFVPTATRIRPMGWTAMVFLFAVILLAFGMVASIETARKDRRFVAAGCGVLLSLTPIFVASFALVAVCAIRGVELAD